LKNDLKVQVLFFDFILSNFLYPWFKGELMYFSLSKGIPPNLVLVMVSVTYCAPRCAHNSFKACVRWLIERVLNNRWLSEWLFEVHNRSFSKNQRTLLGYTAIYGYQEMQEPNPAHNCSSQKI
jgi:hypothetical protein